MSRLPEILSRQLIARTRRFAVEEVQLRFSNGTEVTYEHVPGWTPQGAVLCVPLDGNHDLLLIKEYAVSMNRYELGFPKGVIETNETPLQAANREMMEEVGYGASQLDILKVMALAPGYVGHKTHLVLGRGLYPARLVGDEPEPLELVRWPLNQAQALLDRDDFTDARSIAALLWVMFHTVNGCQPASTGSLSD